jgi:tRNA(Arg) A34 adenosine deaminase TadA
MFGLVREGAFNDEEFEAFLRRDDVRASKMMDVIEYGRMVHAEMNAITDAARRGVGTKDATLYCTTFPCHICAKHIVASGVMRVVYLEPYPKSLAQELHADSISVDGSPRGKYQHFPVVAFEHFAGVTPRRYREFFERGKRKDSRGDFVPYVGNQRRPNLRIVQPYYAQSETLFIRDGFRVLKNVANAVG